MTEREVLNRLALQKDLPHCFVPCRWCPVGRQCPHCVGTGKVSKATARDLAGEGEKAVA